MVYHGDDRVGRRIDRGNDLLSSSYKCNFLVQD